jgi:hypothetical protein
MTQKIYYNIELMTSCITHYKLGGLESSNKERKLKINDITYIINDKFIVFLRDTVLNWETFLEIYDTNEDICLLFDQAVKLLDLKDNQHLRKDILLTLKSVYELPAEAHLTCMLKQYVSHESLSIVIYNIFMLIKTHYEKIVIKFIELRNKYLDSIKEGYKKDKKGIEKDKDKKGIEKDKDKKDTKKEKTKKGIEKDKDKKDKDKKDGSYKKNDIDKLLKVWLDLDQQYDIQSSSIILLFLNPKLKDINIKLDNNKIHWTMPKISTKKLTDSIKKFHYKGFCKRVPKQRLEALLAFPLNEFITIIQQLEDKLGQTKTEFPKYNTIEKQISALLAPLKKPEIPKMDNLKPRKKPPSTDSLIERGKFYIKEIIDLRKKLLPYGIKYEEYYNTLAERLVPVYDILKEEL